MGSRRSLWIVGTSACIGFAWPASVAFSTTQLTPKQALIKRDVVVSRAATQATVGQLIVKLREPSSDEMIQPLAAGRMSTLSSRAGVPMRGVRAMAGGASIVQLDAPLPLAEAQAVAARIAQDPGVEYAEPDLLLKKAITPNEVRYTEWQWNYFAPGSTYTGALRAGGNKATTAVGGSNLPTAWDRTTGSNAVTIAVIDSGIVNHPDLNGSANHGAAYAPSGRWLPGYDFVSGDIGSPTLPANFVANDGDGRDIDPSDPGDWVTAQEKTMYPNQCNDGRAGQTDSAWHGTHMAGIVGATANNSLGIAGVDWVARIVPIRALGKCGGSTSDIADAIRWAAGLAVNGVPPNQNPAQVISLSLGGSGTCGQTLQAAVTAAINAGATVVAATGNDGEVTIGQPANCTGVIAVTAHTINGESADYGNVGAGTSVSAPGGGTPTLLGAAGATDDPTWNGYYIWSALLFGPTTRDSADASVPPRSGAAYAGFTGTSPATPHAAGVAALIKAVQPAASPAFVKSWISSGGTTRPHPAGGFCALYLPGCGGGLLDAQRAVQAAIDRLPAVSAGNPRVVAPGAAVAISGTETAYPTRNISSRQWMQTSGPSVVLANANTLNPSFTAPTSGMITLRLRATDNAGMVGEDSVAVRINTAPVLVPVANRAAIVGETLTFSVTATDADGDPLLFTATASPTGSTLSATGQFSWNTNGRTPGTYVLNYNAFDGFANSASGSVTITLLAASGAPTITGSPQGATINEGQSASFSVAVIGAAPLTYQWRRNGTPITGATAAGYTTPALAATDSGALYSVVVSNSAGSATSASAMVTVMSTASPGTGAANPPSSGGGGALPLAQLLLLLTLVVTARVQRGNGKAE